METEGYTQNNTK